MKSYLYKPRTAKMFRIVFVDAFVVVLAFIISHFFCLFLCGKSYSVVFYSDDLFMVALGVCVNIMLFYVIGLYNRKFDEGRKRLFVRSIFSVFISSFILMYLVYFLWGYKVDQSFFFVQFSIMLVFFYLWRVFGSRIRNRESGRKGVVLIGEDLLTERILSLLNGEVGGYYLAGFVGEKENFDIVNADVFSSPQDAVLSTNAGAVVVCGSLDEIDFMESELLKIKFNNVDIFSGAAFYEQVLNRIPLHEVSTDRLLMSMREGMFHPFFYPRVKRVIDIIISVIMLAITLPLTVVIAVLIKTDSKGGVLFVQERLGMDDNSFVLYKFRTMMQDAEKHTGPRWSGKDDDRCTRVGSFLRKTRLDELPQFWNVFIGDMSLVGPRPIRRHFSDVFTEKFPYYYLRSKVRPGITGWAQVNMGYVSSEEDQYVKLEYDVFYIYNQSFFIDFFIMLKTIHVMIFMKGE